MRSGHPSEEGPVAAARAEMQYQMGLSDGFNVKLAHT